MSTRREFIKQSAVLAAVAVILPEAFNINTKAKPKIVVLGAGLAGLSAAYKLSKHGFEVTVLEARKRIGGRVFSHLIDKEDNLVVELGGEWIGASHKRIIEMCGEFNLELQNNQLDTHLIYANEYFPKSKWSYSEEWKAKLKSIFSNYHNLTIEDKQKLDKMDWWRFLVNNGISERDLQLRNLFDSTDFGECIRFVSAYQGLAEYAESDERDEMDFKIKGGNSMLPEKLASIIGLENIKLGYKVTEVSNSDGEVTVTCSNGESFGCHHLICAIPTFSISKINWKPGLPQQKIDAINALQYARINKNAVLFNERFWEDESFDMVTDTYGHYFYHATKNQKSSKGVLISYIIGDKADVIYRQNDEFQSQVVVNSLMPAFGDIRDKILSKVNYYWGTDEFSKGAYAIYGKGQWFTIMPVLKERFMNIHFAGEHLADWQGFMEGAVNSGEDAADEIMG